MCEFDGAGEALSLLPGFAPILDSVVTTMEKQEALRALALYQVGAIHCASAHLGFDISADKLTKTQAKKFHKFITPLLAKVCKRMEGDENKLDELERVYTETMPSTLLCYLLEKEFTLD